MQASALFTLGFLGPDCDDLDGFMGFVEIYHLRYFLLVLYSIDTR